MIESKTAELTPERFRLAHHYFVDGVVAKSQVLEEAQRRAMDKRKPEDSVVHYHSYSEKKCNGECEPDEYAANVGLIKKEETDGS